jgi:hypothetical protein
VFVPVAAGDTLSQIAADNGASLSSVEAANPGITDPNTIYVGQSVVVPTGGSFAQWSPSDSPSTSPSHASVVPSTPSQPSSSGASSDSGGIDDIPGVPSSFVSCVAFRESTDGTNAAYNGGDFGIITASGYNVNGQSLGAQKQAFKEIYDTTGPSAWAADGCPGT